jgi:hypothetical protein
MPENPDSIKFSISNGQNRKNEYFQNITLKKVIFWIDQKDIDQETKNELKRMVSRYPHHALERWINNYTKNVSNARKNLRSRNKTTNLPKTEDEFLKKTKNSFDEDSHNGNFEEFD